MAEPLELHDMQRLILDGLADFPESTYALITIYDHVSARAWLGTILAQRAIDRATERGEDRDPKPEKPPDPPKPPKPPYALSMAFTWKGLQKLGLGDARGFLAPFREGMITEPRAANLGDPKGLSWGKEPFHILLMVFSKAKCRETDWVVVKQGLTWGKVDRVIEGHLRPDRKEHFGFADGISQPYIEGSNTSKRPIGVEAAANTVKPGEFILGYANEAAVLPTSPTVPGRLDPYNVLTTLPAQDLRDFGRNGSYLVLRQLRQRVAEFNEYLDAAAKEEETTPEWIAAKIVGRWKSGAPIVRAPYGDRPALSDDNDFAYYDADRHGFACPLGAHIRRANPRDSLTDDRRGIGPELAAALTRRHRLIRRGRLYDDGKDKGMLFMCLNANIQDQFEFVQHQWLNSPRLAGLDAETDPLLGPHGGKARHTVQAADGSMRLENLKQFVEVVGGGYFFLPGLKALECVSRLP